MDMHFQRLLLKEQGILSSNGGHQTIPPVDHHSHPCCYPQTCGAVDIEVANNNLGIVIVQGIWVNKLELFIWWFVDRSDGDTANVDGEYIKVVVLGH